MTTAFVDSSAWVALVLQRDSQHALARQFFRSIVGSVNLVTSNCVLGEAITFLTYRQRRAQPIQLNAMIESAAKANLLTIEWVTLPIHERAWEIYRKFADQTFSYWDCSSFAICEARNVDFAFSFDLDFTIAGFEKRP